MILIKETNQNTFKNTTLPQPKIIKMLSKMKKPGVPYFTPDKRQCLILGNIDYAAIRYMGVDRDGNPTEKGFANLLEV